MAQPKGPSESHAKAGENGDGRPSLERFRRLAKALSDVDPDAVREAERQEREAKNRRGGSH